jgi:hypothetical protein
LATGCIVSYAYIMEFIIAWYSGSAMEKFHFMNRALGPMWWGWVMMMGCNMIIPQLFWFKKVRRTSCARVHPVDLREHRHVV